MSLRTFRSLLLLSCLFISQLLLANEPAYTLIPDEEYKLDRKVFIKKEGKKYGLVNKRGKEVLPAKYDSLVYTELANQYIAYLQNTKGTKAVGVITERDKKIIPIGYQHIQPVALTLYTVTNFEGFSALYDSEGKAKTSFTFDEITAFKGKVARFYRSGKAGLINSRGEILLPAAYKDIIIRSDSTADVINLRNWKILDGNNRQLNNLHFDSIRPLGPDRWATSINFYNSAGQSTLMSALTNTKGEQLIPYRPMYIYAFEGAVAKIKKNQQFGVIQRDGSYLLPAEFDSIAFTDNAIIAGVRAESQWSWHLFSLKGKKKSRHTYQAIAPPIPAQAGTSATGDAQTELLMPAKLKGRWGYINQEGEEVLTCRYDTTYAFEGDLARVRFSNSMGVINRQGNWQIRPFADYITIVSPTRFIARNQGNHQLIDEKGEVLLQTPHVLLAVKGGLLEVNTQKQFGLFDLNGRRLTPTEFQWISDLQDGEIFLAKKWGKKGILSKDGKQFIAESDDTFDKLYGLNEGYLAVEIDRQQGFVDTRGRLRISNRYDSVGAFSNEYAAVKLMGRWGYIDKLERIKIQPLYQEAGPFEEDLAVIKKAGAYGLINKKGEVLIEPTYEKIHSLNGGRFLIVKEGKMGITDKAANTLLSAKYDHIEDLKNGYFLVSRNGKKGLIDYQGVSTIPMMYDTLLWDEINEVYLCSERGENIERKKLRQ